MSCSETPCCEQQHQQQLRQEPGLLPVALVTSQEALHADEDLPPLQLALDSLGLPSRVVRFADLAFRERINFILISFILLCWLSFDLMVCWFRSAGTTQASTGTAAAP
jgi:hypothetical protein